MKRSSDYWVWLLADVSLDRAVPVLPQVGFPVCEHAVVQRGIDVLGEELKPGATLSSAADRMVAHWRRDLGDKAQNVEAWFRAFAFTDDASRPDLYYWDSRLNDMFVLQPAPAPQGIDGTLWRALSAACKGATPASGYPWSDDFSLAAAAVVAHRTTVRALEQARKLPMTSRDIAVYLRFGWNDYGDQKGLCSLEIGSRLSAVRQFWRAVSKHVPASQVEALAYSRDIDDWNAIDSAAFAADAQKIGITVDQMKLELFPRPQQPPRLDAILED